MNIVVDALRRKAQIGSNDEIGGIGSLLYEMHLLLLESSQQEVFPPIYEVEILDYEELKLQQEGTQSYWILGRGCKSPRNPLTLVSTKEVYYCFKIVR